MKFTVGILCAIPFLLALVLFTICYVSKYLRSPTLQGNSSVVANLLCFLLWDFGRWSCVFFSPEASSVTEKGGRSVLPPVLAHTHDPVSRNNHMISLIYTKMYCLYSVLKVACKMKKHSIKVHFHSVPNLQICLKIKEQKPNKIITFQNHKRLKEQKCFPKGLKCIH